MVRNLLIIEVPDASNKGSVALRGSPPQHAKSRVLRTPGVHADRLLFGHCTDSWPLENGHPDDRRSGGVRAEIMG